MASRILVYIAISASFLSGYLHADWNKKFDHQSHELVQQLPLLQNSDYIKDFNFFIAARNKILKDKALVEEVANSANEERLWIEMPDLGVMLKKRPRDRIYDLYPWELSYLLRSNKYVLPSFPMEIGGKKVILQRFEQFEVGHIYTGGYSEDSVGKVALETYWKALLQAYLMGLGDLKMSNIGINADGLIRFFDNEACFVFRNAPYKMHLGMKAAFLCQIFDWPQYRQPLDKQLAKQLRAFVSSFLDYVENFAIYQKCRELALDMDAIAHRLKKVKDFKIRPGVTFRDFFGSLYPRMNPGLDQLNQIISGILKKEIDHGSALIFFSRMMKLYPQSTAKQQTAIDKWIDIYIE